MKKFLKTFAFHCTFTFALMAVSAPSFSETTAVSVVSQQREHLRELEAVGYRPVGSQINYPDNIAAANARLAEIHSHPDAQAFGPEMNGTSQAGGRAVPSNFSQ